MSELEEHGREVREAARRVYAADRAELVARAEAAEAAVARVKLLADEFDLPREQGGGDFGPFYAEKVRAALGV